MVTLIIGGFIFFVVPGFMFSIWYIFSMYIVVFSSTSGTTALSLSKELTRGYFGKIFSRILISGIVALIITYCIEWLIKGAVILFAGVTKGSYAVSAIVDPQLYDGLMRQITPWFNAAFMTLVGLVLYKNMIAIRPLESLVPSRKKGVYFIGILGLPLVLASAYILSLTLFTRDIPPIDDSDLRPDMRIVNDTDNGFMLLSRLQDKIQYPSEKTQLIDDLRKGKSWDETFVGDLLRANNEAFWIFDEMAQSPSFQDPVYADPTHVSFSTALVNFNPLRLMAKLNAVRAYNEAQEGNTDRAVMIAMNTISVGYKVQSSYGGIITYLVGLAVRDIGEDSLRAILQKSYVSDTMLRRLQTDLAKFVDNKTSLQNDFKIAYLAQANSMSFWLDATNDPELASTGAIGLSPYQLQLFKLSYLYRKNETQKLFADNAKINIDSSSALCKNIINKEPSNQAPWIKASQVLLRENGVGRILADIAMTNLESIQYRRCLEDFSVESIRTIIALELYHRDKGGYPQSLNDLVPAQIGAVPIDSFDGQELRYSKDKKILYVVGKDLVDDGGSVSDSWRDAIDPTLDISMPESLNTNSASTSAQLLK